MSRPTVMTELIVKKLEEAFALGCNDEEACVYGGICKQTLYNFQDKNQEFLDRKELLKSTPVLLARKTVVDSLSSDPYLALRFLERKKKDEFGLHENKTYNPEPIQIIIQDYKGAFDNEKQTSKLEPESSRSLYIPLTLATKNNFSV